MQVRVNMASFNQSKVLMVIFIRPVWAGLFSFRTGLVPGPLLCPSAKGAAETPPEILWDPKRKIITFFSFRYHKFAHQSKALIKVNRKPI